MTHEPAPPILVVDDEPEMCWAMEHVLKEHGYEVATAGTAKTALALLRRQPPRLIFLDAKLPDMEGLEAARRIRKRTPGVPVVLVSGYFYLDDPAIRAALEAGTIRGFVAKPFTHADIVQAAEQFALAP